MLDALCVRVHDPTVCVFASQSRAPQGRLKSPKFKSGFYTKFGDHCFLLTLERACEAQICVGIRAFSGCEKLKNFLARRGSASRPARPRLNFVIITILGNALSNGPSELKTNWGHQISSFMGAVPILDVGKRKAPAGASLTKRSRCLQVDD